MLRTAVRLYASSSSSSAIRGVALFAASASLTLRHATAAAAPLHHARLAAGATLACHATLHTARRHASTDRSDAAAPIGEGGTRLVTMDGSGAGGSGKPDKEVTSEQVWQLWNEGNLFSLSIAQMQRFLNAANVTPDPSNRKAALVRQIEEYLHRKDSSSSSGGSSAAEGGRAMGGAAQSEAAGQLYGRWATRTMQPETLLDLTQSGFYEGVASMAPKAFQLLVDKSAADLVVARVSTSAFPGFPANTECYTLVANEADVSLRTRFSKVLQWCILNMGNLHMDAELSVGLGKLLLTPRAVRQDEQIVSTYTLQQRMQLHRPYTWVAAVPPSAIAVAEEFLRSEGFTSLTPSRAAAAPSSSSSSSTSAGVPRQLSYEGTIKTATEELHVELDGKGKLRALHRAWVDVQTVYYTHESGPDVQLLLRSRPPVRTQDVRLYSSFPIVELAADDVSDVLPAEHGQLIYLSENETRRFERVLPGPRQPVVTVKEVRRQPLIVMQDDEEDARVEYTMSVTLPTSSGSQTLNARSIGLEMLDMGRRFAQALREPYVRDFGCTAVTAEDGAAPAKASEEASSGSDGSSVKAV